MECFKLCVDGQKGVVASEVGIHFVSFHKTPPVMCPYFLVAIIPQKINENNDWGSAILNACVAATEYDSNADIVNTSTDGVSFKQIELYTVC